MAILGELETRVMDVLWHTPEALSVRQVHATLTDQKELAYTTVMTVLDRLAKKEIVSRARDGRQWLYLPARRREDLVAEQMMELLTGTAKERQAALEAFAGKLTAGDRRKLSAALGER